MNISYNFNFSIIDTGKPLGLFTYSWNQDGTLSGIQYPNNTLLNITYHNRIQDNITLTKDGNTLFNADATFDGYDRLTSEAIDITIPNGTISEDYSFSYDTLSRLNTLHYSSNNRTITYGYDLSVGDRLTQVSFSDTGTYSITYDTKGRIDCVTYPNNQGTENYTYNDTDGKGRLSNITYPDGKSLSFSWNSRGKLTQLTAVEGSNETNIMFSYDGMNRISGYNKTITELGSPPQTEEWNFYYGLTGIEKATRKQNQIQNLTIDYSTDTNGNILSMSYNEIGGYSGELFYTFDSFGNTSTLTDSQGNVIVGYIYDLNNGAIKNEYDPQGINNLFMSNKIILLKIGDITLIKDLESSSTVISNDCGIINTLDAGVSPPYYVRPMQFVIWWLYYQEGWSITDLCECFPPYGFHPDEIRNAEDCDELEQIMKDAKYNWDEHVESWGKSGDITNESDVIGYLSFPMFDTPCQTMAWSGCEYWTAKDEWEKRGCK